MNKIIYTLFLLSFLFSDESIHRCGLELLGSSRNNTPPVCSNYIDSSEGNFRIWYGDCESTVDVSYFLNTVNATSTYLSSVAEAAEYSKSILISMGFNSEASDNDGIYDIYLSNRPNGFYGVNYPSSEGGSFIVIDNDYSGFTCGECYVTPESLELMKITVAHEFFHAIQRTYVASNAISNLYFWELSSTWFEDVAYPNVNDYINWSTYDYLVDPEQDISLYQPATGYSLALFGHYLTKIYDQTDNEQNSDIMRLIWEDFDGLGTDEALESINNVLENNYNSSFSDAWSDFNTRNIFNGQFSNMNNSIYYYEDQQYAPPSNIGNNQYISSSHTVSDITTDWGEVEIRGYQTASGDNDFFTLDLNDNQDCGTSFGGFNDFVGFLAVESMINNTCNRIYNLADLYLDSTPRTISLDLSDKFYFILANNEASTNWDYCLDIPVNYLAETSYNTADLNLDNQINILDLVLLIDVILNYEGISHLQFELIDLNNDAILNIIDAVALINIILNT